MVAEANYGGRVTDDKDLRCLIAMLASYFNESALKGGFLFS